MTIYDLLPCTGIDGRPERWRACDAIAPRRSRGDLSGSGERHEDRPARWRRVIGQLAEGDVLIVTRLGTPGSSRHFAQGYAFGRPISAIEARKLVGAATAA